MGSVTIRPVRGRRELKRFVKVPFHLHRDAPQWVPPLIFERMQFLDREKEPVVRARRGRVLRRRARRRAGRARSAPSSTAAGTSTRAAATRCSASSRRPTTRRSRAALLGAATEWAAGKGRGRLLGPMDFTTNDEVGILIEGYERRPMILEPWHPPFYRALIEAEGFAKAMDVLMWQLQHRRAEGRRALRPVDPCRRQKGAARGRDRDPQHAQARDGERGAPLHGGLQRGLGRQLGLRARSPTPRSSSRRRT